MGASGGGTCGTLPSVLLQNRCAHPGNTWQKTRLLCLFIVPGTGSGTHRSHRMPQSPVTTEATTVKIQTWRFRAVYLPASGNVRGKRHGNQVGGKKPTRCDGLGGHCSGTRMLWNTNWCGTLRFASWTSFEVEGDCGGGHTSGLALMAC